MIKSKIKALGLLSGGLDSILAVKLMLEQGIKVIGVNFKTPFLAEGDKDYAQSSANQLNIPLKTIKLGLDYLKMVRFPKHGYGSGLNPCLDCRIFLLEKAEKLAKKLGAQFIFTGEVLGQRPMSQHRGGLDLAASQSGLAGKILRPLSANLLAETEAEKRGWVDRKKLMGISGRSRKIQLALAEKWGIKDYSQPAGGCLLTDKNFAKKLKDLFICKKKITLRDIEVLKIGRHFRLGRSKIIVGRNYEENQKLLKLKSKSDYYFDVVGYPGPTALLTGAKTKKAVERAAFLTAYYSRAPEGRISLRQGPKRKIIICQKSLAQKTTNELLACKI